MKRLHPKTLANLLRTLRKAKHLTQEQLSEQTGINRIMIGRIERCDYVPSIDQLQLLGETLGFEPTDVFVNDTTPKASTTAETSSATQGAPQATTVDITAKTTSAITPSPKLRIAVAGTGYVGLSLAVLLSQHHQVTAVDIIPEKVDLINKGQSPIQDDYIEAYLAEKGLNLTATLDGEAAYKDADFVIIAAPTNYDSQKNFFDCSAVETVIYNGTMN